MPEDNKPGDAPALPSFLVGADAETIGHTQNRGWDKLPADQAARAAIQAHREAEKLIGVPAERIVRLPADKNDEAGWNEVHQRLGAPKDAKDYDFTDVKFASGEALDQQFVDFIRVTAAENHLSKEAATRVAKSMVKFVEEGDKSEVAERQVTLKAQQDKLIADWGPANVEVNMIIAKAAATKFGPAIEAGVKALEGQVGYADVMKMMHVIGTKIGEDQFIRNLNGGGSPTLTREQAVARKAELMRDNDWQKRYLSGGAPEVREMNALIAIELG